MQCTKLMFTYCKTKMVSAKIFGRTFLSFKRLLLTFANAALWKWLRKWVRRALGVKSRLLRSRRCQTQGSGLSSPSGSGECHNQLCGAKRKGAPHSLFPYQLWALGRDKVHATSLVHCRCKIKQFPQSPSKAVCRVWDNSKPHPRPISPIPLPLMG